MNLAEKEQGIPAVERPVLARGLDPRRVPQKGSAKPAGEVGS